MNVPHLYEIDRKGMANSIVNRGVPFPSADWVASETISGVPVRVTVRTGIPVRLEVVQRPTRPQRQAQIKDSWFRDASDDPLSADVWLHEAVASAVFGGVPDGEWEGTVIGPKVLSNPYDSVTHRLYLESLVPWASSLSSLAPIPPILPMCPVEYNTLSEWFQTRKSRLSDITPMYGVTFWAYDEPVAQVLRSEFVG